MQMNGVLPTRDAGMLEVDHVDPPETVGLTTSEAQSRLREFGWNETSRKSRSARLTQLILLLANPLVVILLIASVASAVLGERVSAAIIATIVVVSVVINAVQSYRSQRVTDALRSSVALVAEVRRDGRWIEIPTRELVPGDIVRLKAGDLVPADGRLVEARDLHAQEAALTGESLPVEKMVPAGKDDTQRATSRSHVYLGTSIISGTAITEVTATGRKTAFGDIAARLSAAPPPTEFERGLRQFGYLITRTVIFLLLFVLLFNLALHRDPLESFLFALALAVGLTPEFLPMITTVTLGQGAMRLGRRKVIVKQLAAIQNLGSIDVLCSDKTGTLTSGDMLLEQPLDSDGCASEWTGTLGYLNSSFETGFRNPLDAAILAYNATDVTAYEKVDELPFDFERRRLSIVVRQSGRYLLITKGAPESILPICASYESGERVLLLDDAARARIDATFQTLSRQGKRVLAIGYRDVATQSSYRVADEVDLIFAGFLPFTDPLLPDTLAIVRALQDDGVAIKVLTGDNELVAKHVCEAVGLDGSSIVLGDDLEHIDNHALEHIAETSSIFARVSPAQKDRVILALMRRGHVVGYLGDGINDAPSLRTADVGISVVNGADIAKDAADIILLERSLDVLHNGILEGRKAFGNVMKYLLMGTSSNFGNMFSMAGASLLLPFLPLLPTQVLLNNLLYDLAQITIPTDKVDQQFIRTPHRWDIGLVQTFMLLIGPISSVYDYLTFYAMLRLFHASEMLFHTGWFVESLVTQTLVVFVIRTAGNPLRSRPSRPLTLSVLAVIVVALVLPFSPIASLLGFVPLPPAYFVFLAVVACTYLLLVEIAKRPLFRRHQL
jgi:Mg2+-importing ATPase